MADDTFLRAFQHAVEIVDPIASEYLADPIRWVSERGSGSLWSKQQEIIKSVRDNRRTAVPSCHNVGKSFTAAMVTGWWIDAHPPGSAFVVTTAPTGPQVKAVLWREINRMHSRAELPGRVNLTEWYLGNEIVAFGRKPGDDEPTAFHGIHAEYVLVVLDEACGIHEPLWDAASTLTSNATSRMLAIGNPDDPASHFAEVCKPNSGWNVISIDAYESPNFTGERVPDVVKNSLISEVYIEEKKKDWGEESPLFISKIRGRFPEDSSDGVVPLSWVQRCREFDDDDDDIDDGLPIELGVDVGAGGDLTIIYERRGNRAGKRWASRHDDPMKCVGEIVQAINETGARSVKIDVIGVGWGVAGRLIELKREGAHNANISKVNVAESAKNKKKFANKRAEMWWEIGREMSRERLWDLRDVDDKVVAELIAPKYTLNSRGQIIVESKDDVRKRIKRSTDDADALMLAFTTVITRGTSHGMVTVENRLPQTLRR